MVESRNPFLLLKHLDMLTEKQIKQLPKNIVIQLRVLNAAIEEGQFSGEQIAEMKIWIECLVRGLKDLNLGSEGSYLLKKILDAF